MDKVQKYNSFNRYLNLGQKVTICANLFGHSYICEEAFLLMRLNTSTQQNQCKDKNFNSVTRLTTPHIRPDFEQLESTVQAQYCSFQIRIIQVTVFILVYLTLDHRKDKEIK
jgi:hypothetical protein